MTNHLGVLLDWTVVDFVVLGIGIQQFISISRDLKRSKKPPSAPGHPEGQHELNPWRGEPRKRK